MQTIKILKKIIAINTENPPGNEEKLADYLSNLLKKFGFTIVKQDIEKHRSNLIAYPDNKNKVTLILNAHLDTVPVGDRKNWQYPPEGEIVGNRIYGRGACDIKGSLVALLSAAIKAKQLGMKHFALLFTADEESGNFTGMKAFIPCQKDIFPNVKYAVVAEPTNLMLGTSHKGVVCLRLTFKGKSAHGATPEKGINAISLAVKTINKINNYHQERLLAAQSSLEKPTLNIGKIQGGDKVNVVPAACVVEMETRLIHNESPDLIIQNIASFVKENGGKTEVIASFPAFMQKNYLFINQAKKVFRRVGINDQTISLNYYSEAEILQREGRVDCLIVGAGKSFQMHVANEYLDTYSFHKAEKVYLELIKSVK